MVEVQRANVRGCGEALKHARMRYAYQNAQQNSIRLGSQLQTNRSCGILLPSLVIHLKSKTLPIFCMHSVHLPLNHTTESIAISNLSM